MQKIGNITSTADSDGEFTDGNVAGGVSPTILPAAWFNTIQRELVNLVQGGSLTLDSANDAQALAAINVLCNQSAPVGVPLPWPTDTPPTGWIAMVGQTISQSVYPE
ncbi:tail fiber protein, partial [Martelella alba]